MRERNTTNINNELCAIERQIAYFEGLEYTECLNASYGGGQLYPLSGLDKEDFHKIKDAIIDMLKGCYNKKSDELIQFCQINRLDIKSSKCQHNWVLIKSCSDTFNTINTYNCIKCGETKTLSIGI